MKKIISWIMILVLSLSLAACAGKTEPTPETAAPTETTAAPETAETTEEPTEVPTVMAKPLYGEILDSYFDALLQGFTPEQYIDKGLNYLVGTIGDVTKVGYCLEDLDGDGNTELLIGAVGEPYIYAMYTVKNDEEIQVIDAGERNTYRLGSDNSFINSGSNSAAQSGTFLMTLENGELKLQDGIIYDATVDEKNPYFYVSGDSFDPATWDTGAYDALETAQAEATLKQLDDSVRPISYMPFSEYQS